MYLQEVPLVLKRSTIRFEDSHSINCLAKSATVLKKLQKPFFMHFQPFKELTSENIGTYAGRSCLWNLPDKKFKLATLVIIRALVAHQSMADTRHILEASMLPEWHLTYLEQTISWKSCQMNSMKREDLEQVSNTRYSNVHRVSRSLKHDHMSVNKVHFHIKKKSELSSHCCTNFSKHWKMLNLKFLQSGAANT